MVYFIQFFLLLIIIIYVYRQCTFNGKSLGLSRIFAIPIQTFIDFAVYSHRQSYYEGLTILGGEPFELQNQPDVLELVLRVKKELPEKNIWMYTGYTYHQDLVPGGCRYIPDVTNTILDHIDVLVDGKFVKEKKNLALYFRGSENQRIIDMKKTRTGNEVILVPFQ